MNSRRSAPSAPPGPAAGRRHRAWEVPNRRRCSSGQRTERPCTCFWFAFCSTRIYIRGLFGAPVPYPDRWLDPPNTPSQTLHGTDRFTVRGCLRNQRSLGQDSRSPTARVTRVSPTYPASSGPLGSEAPSSSPRTRWVEVALAPWSLRKRCGRCQVITSEKQQIDA